MMFCASCGKSELDDVKLMDCADCKSVRYCSDVCKKDHWPEHEEKCKERAVVLREELLFRQPENTHLGDCPICCLPLPIEKNKSSLLPCCSKVICGGCAYAHETRQWDGNRQRLVCPFCRHSLPDTREEENIRKLMKRVAANDPIAMRKMGVIHFHRKEFDAAFESWTKATESGDVGAHYNLSLLYSEGQGVEKDEKKEIFHLEEAAIAGHPTARNNLAFHEGENGRIERAVKHLIIAANLGFDESMAALKEYYKEGLVSKEDFAAALRAHHAAVKAMKSPQREAAQKCLNEYKERVGRPSKW